MCCGTEEIVFLVLFGSYFVINLLLWKTFILKPMKLMAVFVHEMGHATMCWLTGGKVNAINVETNEGGVTKYQGGNRCCIIPAGYLGGAFVGGLLVTLVWQSYCSYDIGWYLCLCHAWKSLFQTKLHVGRVEPLLLGHYYWIHLGGLVSL